MSEGRSGARTRWAVGVALAVALMTASTTAVEVGAQEQPCQAPAFVLATGDPATTDGALSIRVDGVGMFGTARAGDAGAPAVFNPPGAAAGSSTVFSSDVFTSIVGVLACASVGDVVVVSSSDTDAVTRFTARGLDVELTQSVRRSGDVGSILTQTYRLRNPGEGAVPVSVVRHVDGDLLFDGTFQDGGAATVDGSALYEFDSSEDPAEPSTYVGITGSFDGRIAPDHWTMQPYEFLTRIVEAGGVPEELDGLVANDVDRDRVVDVPYDVTLSQQWDGTLAPFSDAVFTTVTRFGRIPPAEVVEPRVAGFTTDRRELVFPEQLGLTTSPPQLVTGTNPGTGDVVVRHVTAVGPAAGDVVIASDSCTGARLVPRGTCAVSVSLRPSIAGARDANLVFDTTAAVAPAPIPVLGMGATPHALVNPAVVNPGETVEVTGTSFPPDVDVDLSWVDPVTLAGGGYAEPATSARTLDDGTFVGRLIVFPNSRIGGRVLSAVIDTFTATQPFLVAPGSAQGPDFVPRR